MAMKIVADENLLAVSELFSPFGDVKRVPGRQITSRDIADAQVLLVRSVTQVNRQLLADSSVGFVGSATIGMDHLDTAWLDANGIAYANAPGCNAEAVVDFVIATLCHLEMSASQINTGGETWFDKSILILGAGNVGGRLYQRLRQLGLRPRCYDPFLGPEQQADLCEFSALQEADIICLHTPLTREGPHPTWHLLDETLLRSLKPGALIINAGRGEVVDNAALLSCICSGQLRAALDVWENEPDIDPELLQRVEQGTPHIAGYSLEGRLRGTLMLYQSFCQWRGVKPLALSLEKLAAAHFGAAPKTLGIHPRGGKDVRGQLADIVTAAYNPERDYLQMLEMSRSREPIARGFDELRKNYPLRREFSSFDLADHVEANLRRQLAALGFEKARARPLP